MVLTLMNDFTVNETSDFKMHKNLLIPNEYFTAEFVILSRYVQIKFLIVTKYMDVS